MTLSRFRSLLSSLVLTLSAAACGSPGPTLSDRCLAECDRSRENPSCDGYDGCVAVCRSTVVETCATELDALIDCTEALSVEALCGGAQRSCDAENTALGVCIATRPDAGSGDAGMP